MSYCLLLPGVHLTHRAKRERELYSVRRVSDYLSSHIDLDDYIHKDMGCTQRDGGPKELKNHHAPLSQGARNQPVYSKEQFIQESLV